MFTELHRSYLNTNGCDEEGLYRVPGSGKDIKKWEKRFDTGKLSKNKVASRRSGD
jgi:hypothetical protein